MADYKLKFTAAEIDEKLSSIDNISNAILLDDGVLKSPSGEDITEDIKTIINKSEIFIATYGATTLAELKEAWNSGNTPILLYQAMYYPLTSWYVTGGAADNFLFGDTYRCHSGGWITSTPSWHSNFTGATSSAAGKTGLVPTPVSGDQDKFLKGNGTWAEVSSGSIIIREW